MEMQIRHPQQYDRFMDTIKLTLILWRQQGTADFAQIAEKLGISERTARRRFQSPETLTLAELYAWCELCGKDPGELVQRAFREAGKEKTTDTTE